MKNNSSSRAPAPPPLSIEPTSRVNVSPTQTPESAASDMRFPSGDYASMMSSPPYSRKASGSSMGSTSSKKAKSPKVNANSYCGRHSDEFLFGGHTLGDLWRSIKKKE